MGMFDTYVGLSKEDIEKLPTDGTPFTVVEAQLKVGDPVCDVYFIGDTVDKGIPDGLYLGHDGFVAIQGGKLVGVFNELQNSSGEWVLCKASEINFGNEEAWRTLYGKENYEIMRKNKVIEPID